MCGSPGLFSLMWESMDRCWSSPARSFPPPGLGSTRTRITSRPSGSSSSKLVWRSEVDLPCHLPPPGRFVQFLPNHAINESMNDWGATQRVPAEVVLTGGAVLGGDLHLATRLTYPADVESPLEMLNRADPFFALTLHAGGVAFLSKAQVVVVSCRENSESDPARASAAKLVALDVELTDGSQFRGRSSFES